MVLVYFCGGGQEFITPWVYIYTLIKAIFVYHIILADSSRLGCIHVRLRVCMSLALFANIYIRCLSHFTKGHPLYVSSSWKTRVDFAVNMYALVCACPSLVCDHFI